MSYRFQFHLLSLRPETCLTDSIFIFPFFPLLDLVASFYGQDFLQHPLSPFSCRPCEEISINLSFKAAKNNGVIFSLKTGLGVMSVELTSLRLKVSWSLQDQNITDGMESKLAFSVGKWHAMALVASNTSLAVTVDNKEIIKFTPGYASRLVSPHNFCHGGLLQLGGTKRVTITGTFQETSRNMFVGCLRNVQVFGQDILSTHVQQRRQGDNLDLKRVGKPFISTTCKDFARCREEPSFLLPSFSSAVSLNPWSFRHKGQVKFAFRSEEKNGLILAAEGKSDYLFLQLDNGSLCVLLKQGNYSKRVCSREELPFGAEQHVVLTKHKRSVWLHINGKLANSSAFPIVLPRSDFSLGHELVFGRIESTCGRLLQAQHENIELRSGFRGCLSRVSINGGCPLRLRDFACSSNNPRNVHGAFGIVHQGCWHNFCDVRGLCRNGGLCVSGLTSASCNCHGTGFFGEICEKGKTL